MDTVEFTLRLAELTARIVQDMIYHKMLHTPDQVKQALVDVPKLLVGDDEAHKEALKS